MSDVEVGRLEERQKSFEQLLKAHNEHDDERFDAMRTELQEVKEGVSRVERKLDDFILKIEKRMSAEDATKLAADKQARSTAAKWATGISAFFITAAQILSAWAGF